MTCVSHHLPGPYSSGWDAASAARLAAEVHGCYGWDVEPSARGAAEVRGWEGGSPDAAADAAATLRSPAVGWNAARAAGPYTSPALPPFAAELELLRVGMP